MLYPVILSGGSGTRLWPASQPKMPKQFLPLTSEHSVLQETVLRLRSLGIDTPPVFVCNALHQYLIEQQMSELNIPAEAIIVEPVARNTAPAVAAAAFAVAEVDAEGLMIVLPSDHVIQDTDAFKAAIDAGCRAAEAGYIVTFGIEPTKAHTGYGYIQQGEAIAGLGPVYHVDSFHEKPDAPTAAAYLHEGGYSWNSGMFLMSAARFLEELKTHAPEVYRASEQAFAQGVDTVWGKTLDAEVFAQSPSESIDVAVMEKTTAAAVVTADMGWSDIGTWGSLWEISPKDDAGNVAQNQVYMRQSQNCYVNSSKPFVAILGVDDLIVIETPDALLIAHKKDEQWVKDAAQHFS